jgi:subtilisin family serine protease
MRNFLRFGFVLLFIFWGFDGVGQTIDPDYIDGEFYIKLKTVDRKSLSKTSSAVNFQKELPFLSNLTSTISVASAERSFYFSNSELLQSVYRVKIDNPKKGLDFMNSVEQDDNVEYIERVPLMKKSLVPNDPYENSTNTYALAKIRAYDAWSVSTGRYYVTVAVVDDAVQTNHPDLAGNMVAGYDVADNDSDPNPPNTYFSHGTHVAGIAGAVTNNGIGVASLGFNTIRIMPVKASYTGAYIEKGYEGVIWAAEHGADIINMSWGGYGYSQTNQNTISYAHSLGSILVASAGNDNVTQAHHPSSYNYVISVASTDSNDNLSTFSNYGSQIDVAAPGSSIYSTIPYGGYNYKSGTSMASPLVASLCAYILSQNRNLNTDDVEYILKNSSDDIDNSVFGAGRINALNAVNYKYFRSQNINGQNLCSGSNLYIDLITYGNYYSGNQFYIQYAQINSSTFYNLSTTKSTFYLSGYIPTTLPAGYYKIRVVSTSPSIIGDYSTVYLNGTSSGISTGSPIASQYALATTTLYNATSTCAGNSIALYASLSGYDSYWWTKDGLNYTSSSTDSYFNASSTGNYTLNMMKCGNVYRSSNSIYLTFYNTSTPSITASSNGSSTTNTLATCESSTVTLNTGCQSGMNPLWNDGFTSSIRYLAASSTRDFTVNCNNYFCKTAYSPPVRITALNPNVQSQRNGNWQDATLWTSNLVPLNCQTVTIQTGHTVNVPINDAKAKNIIIKGNLNFLNVSPTVKGKVGLGI